MKRWYFSWSLTQMTRINYRWYFKNTTPSNLRKRHVGYTHLLVVIMYHLHHVSKELSSQALYGYSLIGLHNGYLCPLRRCKFHGHETADVYPKFHLRSLHSRGQQCVITIQFFQWASVRLYGSFMDPIRICGQTRCLFQIFWLHRILQRYYRSSVNVSAESFPHIIRILISVTIGRRIVS